ncbi:MAG: hypothetical protein CME26_02935 [Gemmatimonadetes bacterium]|nr:hypothetical protein [Gemmatimonadota bacterium]|tara:strand:+ start:3040 stop:4917 length:1878 start_codon:yes stop_codon:yes gene_type:complete
MSDRLKSEQPIIGVGTLNLSARAIELVNDVLSRNRLSYGPMTESFERQFAAIHGCRFASMTNSGTSALHVALGALKEIHGWEDGDEVIVPAVTFVATPNVVLHNRMTPVLVDVEREFYGIDPNLIESAITERTRAIIPVHVFGQACDMDPVLELAKRHDLKVIEDSCECMFARYKGRSVGSLGDIGCFSTYVAHLLTTGVGGLATTNVAEYAVRIRSLMNHGRDSIYTSIDDDNEKSGDELRMIVERRFSFASVGHSFRATEMEAALGVAQLEDFEDMLVRRRANASRLGRDLAEFDDHLQLPKARPECDHSYMMFPIVLRDRPKAEFLNYLEEHGVETRDMLPLVNQPIYTSLLGTKPGQFPVADWIGASGFYIGCHQDLKQTDLDYVYGLFRAFWRQYQPKSADRSTLVLATHNSEKALAEVVDQLPIGHFDGVVALDSGSTDGTVEILKGHSIPIVETDDVLGTVTERQEHENLVVFPVDGRNDVRDIIRLLLPLERGADMTVASRFLQEGARHDQNRRFRYRSTGNRVFTLVANLAFFGNSTDALTQFRGYRRSFLREVAPSQTGIGAAYEVAIRAMQGNRRVEEIPTVENVPAETRDRWKALWSGIPLSRVLLREWRRKD